jgi:hypothetical protein
MLPSSFATAASAVGQQIEVLYVGSARENPDQRTIFVERLLDWLSGKS